MPSNVGILRFPAVLPSPIPEAWGWAQSQHRVPVAPKEVQVHGQGHEQLCHHGEPWLCLLPQAVPAATCILEMGRTIHCNFHKQPEGAAAPAFPELQSSSCFNSGSELLVQHPASSSPQRSPRSGNTTKTSRHSYTAIPAQSFSPSGKGLVGLAGQGRRRGN